MLNSSLYLSKMGFESEGQAKNLPETDGWEFDSKYSLFCKICITERKRRGWIVVKTEYGACCWTENVLYALWFLEVHGCIKYIRKTYLRFKLKR